MRAEWIKRRQEGRARVRWWREQRAAIDEAMASVGLLELNAECDRLGEYTGDLEEAIVATPATTMVGIAIKLRYMREVAAGAELLTGQPPADEDYDWQYRFALSALHDAERLAGGQS